MKNISARITRWYYRCSEPRMQALIKLLILIAVFGASSHAFADDGTDLLSGTDQSAWATFNGTGKKYIYLGEGLLALFTYIKTKNVMALIGIVVVAVFINIILKMAGQG